VTAAHADLTRLEDMIERGLKIGSWWSTASSSSGWCWAWMPRSARHRAADAAPVARVVG